MKHEKNKPDFALSLIVAILLGIGLIMVFSASEVSAYLEEGDSLYYFKKQFLWMIISVAALIFASHFNYKRFKHWSMLILGISIFLLVLVLIPGIGTEVNGSTRWIDLGPIGFQPSEVSKICIVIFMAYHLSLKKNVVGKKFTQLLPSLLIMILICGLIMLEPDLGTAVVIAGTVMIMLFVAGAKKTHMAALITACIGIVAVLIAKAPYRLERLLSFMDPWADPLDSGFQVIQSLYALGSGGLFGAGIGQSKQKFLYLPEEHTDFIFAVLGEETGFVGTTVVILLFVALIWRGYKIAVSAQDSFGRLLATGLTTLIGLQALINIGVVTGSLPVTGIALPLISYGGTSLLLTMTTIGILLNISRYTKS